MAAPVLLCFDGSPEAEAAIAKAGELLPGRPAVVLTAWEPVRSWVPYDPTSILTAPLSRLAAEELNLDEIASDVASERNAHGVTRAREASFDASGRIARGKPWRAICEVADELGAEPIVLGARGLGRVESALLGSVSAAVVTHASRAVLVVHPPDAG